MSTAPISRGPMKASSSSAPSSSGLALWKKAGSGAKPSYDVNPIAIAPGRAGLAASVAAAKIRLPTEKLKKRHRQWLYVLVANFFMDAWVRQSNACQPTRCPAPNNVSVARNLTPPPSSCARLRLRLDSARLGFRVAQAMVYFSYMGFYMHEDSVDLDPMAFRLAFGVLAILLGLKQLQLLTGNMEYVAVWVMLASFMIIGHFYGSVRNYLWLYGQEFPCFLGELPTSLTLSRALPRRRPLNPSLTLRRRPAPSSPSSPTSTSSAIPLQAIRATRSTACARAARCSLARSLRCCL